MKQDELIKRATCCLCRKKLGETKFPLLMTTDELIIDSFAGGGGASPGELAKQQGIDRAAAANADILAVARKVAVDLAQRLGEITADDVQAELVRLGYGEHSLGNAAGALFRGEQWEWTGYRRKSKRVHAHANELKVWKLATV